MAEKDEAPAATGATPDTSGKNFTPDSTRQWLPYVGEPYVERPVFVVTIIERGEWTYILRVVTWLLAAGYALDDIAAACRRADLPTEDFVRVLARLDLSGPVCIDALRSYMSTRPMPSADFEWTTLPVHRAQRLIVVSEDLRTMSAEAWAGVHQVNEPPFVFRFGTVPAWIEFNPQAEIRALGRDQLRHVLVQMIEWRAPKPDGQGGSKLIATSPPSGVVADLLATPNLPLPRLERIVRTPIFAADGTMETEPGYHAATSTLYVPDRGFQLPPVLFHPSAFEIAGARDLLDELIGEFPFVGEADHAHTVAAILLPFCRALITGPTPLHLIDKPTPGTGGTLLAEMIVVPAMGTAFEAMTEAHDEDEWRKRLTAKLLTGPGVIVIDNLGARLDSPALSSLLTSTVWTDRALGFSKMVTVPVSCLWLATANNADVSHEIARRIARIRLDAEVEQPWLRDEFRHPKLREWAEAHRADLVWAALTLIRAWVDAGRPSGSTQLGSYESWSKVMGGILQVAGVPGFLANLEDLYAEADIDGRAWSEFVLAWSAKHGTAAVKVHDLFVLASQYLDLGEGSDRSLRTRFGIALARKRDRVISGYKLHQAGTHQGALLWQLTPAIEGGRS